MGRAPRRQACDHPNRQRQKIVRASADRLSRQRQAPRNRPAARSADDFIDCAPMIATLSRGEKRARHRRRRDEARRGGGHLAGESAAPIAFAVLRAANSPRRLYGVTEYQQFADGVAAFMANQADGTQFVTALSMPRPCRKWPVRAYQHSWVVDAAELARASDSPAPHRQRLRGGRWSLPL